MVVSNRLSAMASPFAIRVFGDPVLSQRCTEVDEIDAALAKLAQDMIVTMYDAPGVGLAANQVGVRKRLFVYDSGDGSGAHTVINPVLSEHAGEWTYEEGCLSVPKQYFPITRSNSVLLTGIDLDGNDIEIQADEYLAKIFQHEVDHLDGKLLLTRLDGTQKKKAMRNLRDMEMRNELNVQA